MKRAVKSNWKRKAVNKQIKHLEVEEKLEDTRREYTSKDKQVNMKKTKTKEEYNLQIESEKTEGFNTTAKNIKTIIISLMSDIKTKLYKEIQK
ncbi:7421_t:CDS:2, partial [Gigaspora margarita]